MAKKPKSPVPLAPRRLLAGSQPIRLTPECFACDNRPFDQVTLKVMAVERDIDASKYTGIIVGKRDNFFCVAQFKAGHQVGFIAVEEGDAIQFASSFADAVAEWRAAVAAEAEAEVHEPEAPTVALEAPPPKKRASRAKKPAPVAEEE